MNDKHCENCRHFKKYTVSAKTIQECRRYPPSLVYDGYETPFFPNVEPGDWCGEYEPLENTDAGWTGPDDI